MSAEERSAPHEVWVTWVDGDDGAPFAVDANRAKRLDGDTRYLLASLTCGECGILDQEDYTICCPHHGRVSQSGSAAPGC